MPETYPPTISQLGTHRRVLTDERITIFFALVNMQDRGVPLGESRERIGKQYRISVESVKRIEVEGLYRGWLNGEEN